MMNEIDVLLNIAKKLDQLNIPYMLTGSFAMNYYAQPRMTRDIDIVVFLTKGSEEQLIDVFSNDYYVPKEAVEYAVNNQKMFNVIHNESVIKVDFIVRKNSEYRITEFDRRQKITINNEVIYIVSLEDLIISKLYWAKGSNSVQQKKDIINLLQIKHDQEYLKKWLNKLDLHSYFKEFIDAGYSRKY